MLWGGIHLPAGAASAPTRLLSMKLVKAIRSTTRSAVLESTRWACSHCIGKLSAALRRADENCYWRISGKQQEWHAAAAVRLQHCCTTRGHGSRSSPPPVSACNQLYDSLWQLTRAQDVGRLARAPGRRRRCQNGPRLDIDRYRRAGRPSGRGTHHSRSRSTW